MGNDFSKLGLWQLKVKAQSNCEMLQHNLCFVQCKSDSQNFSIKKHVNLVRRHTLAKISKEIGLGYHIIMSDSEEKTGGRLKLSNLENVLNPVRVSMPDFDIDFCQEKRQKVIDYVQKKYGHVAQIVTFGSLQPRATCPYFFCT